MKRLLLFVLMIMGCCGRFASDAKRCPATPAVAAPVEPLLVRPVLDDVRCRQWVDSVLDKLSLKERIGQLFIYTIAPYQDKANKELLRKVVEDYKVGGLLFSGGLMHRVVTLKVVVCADMPSESGNIPRPNVPVLSSHPKKVRTAKSNVPRYLTFIVLTV